LNALLEDAHARLQAHFGNSPRHSGGTLLATWHPSYVLPAPDEDRRDEEIVRICTAKRRRRRTGATMPYRVVSMTGVASPISGEVAQTRRSFYKEKPS